MEFNQETGIIVLKENVIGNLILGVKTWDSQEEAESYVAYGGRKMAFSTFSSFVTFNPEVASSTCINEPVLYPSYQFNNDACGQIGEVPFDSGVKDENGNKIGGYLHPTKRNVKCIRLRGEKSDGTYLPITCLDYLNLAEMPKVGDTIDVLDGHEICRKYIPAVPALCHS